MTTKTSINILDIKQNEWIKIAERPSSPKSNPPETTTNIMGVNPGGMGGGVPLVFEVGGTNI
jgi:hypothetical protein